LQVGRFDVVLSLSVMRFGRVLEWYWGRKRGEGVSREGKGERGIREVGFDG
jgi:hypothetical protein